MDDPVETTQYKGCKILMYNDAVPHDPRDWDNLGIMYCRHSRYRGLGDEDGRYPASHYLPFNKMEHTGCAELLRKSKSEWCSIYMMEHSGIWLRCDSGFDDIDPYGFDWGLVGYIYVTSERMRQQFKVKRLTKKRRYQAKQLLESEVDTYGAYLNGEVYGFVAYRPDGTQLDSCWGFYDVGLMINVAKDAVDEYAEQQLSAHYHKLRAWMYHHVPLRYRYPAPLFT